MIQSRNRSEVEALAGPVSAYVAVHIPFPPGGGRGQALRRRFAPCALIADHG